MEKYLARRLAEYAAGVRFGDLAPETVHEVRRRVLDSLGCAYGAYDSPVGTRVRGAARAESASLGASIIGIPRHRSTLPMAAFANGAMIRYLDFNDTYLSLEPAHPSDNISACIAAAQSVSAPGEELITAIALAYEVQCRMCDATSIRARGWDHVTYGCFSTALAAGKLLGLDESALEQAVNLAGVNAAAVRQTRVGHLSDWKGCAFANAARNGVFAALLAAQGVSGPNEIFEGPMGFCKQVSGPLPIKPEDWRAPSMILRTSIKFWPAEYHSQSAIDAALQLRNVVGEWQRIESIGIHSFDAAVDIIGSEPEKWRPTTRETADHSMPYCVAVALIDGEVGLAQFVDERIRRSDVVRLMDRTHILRDPELTARYPEGIPNRLQIRTDDGKRHTLEVTYPRGHARNPMTDEEVRSKYRALAAPHLSSEGIRRLEGMVAQLQTVRPSVLMAATCKGR